MMLGAGGRPGEESPYLVIGLTTEELTKGPNVIAGSCFPEPFRGTPLQDLMIVIVAGGTEEEIRSDLVARQLININRPPVVEDHR